MVTAEEAVRARIQAAGRITFAEFMELALYGPGGYYTSGPTRPRDYFTSPIAHPLFGALLAMQAEQCWRLLGSPLLFHVAEPGAGDGRLARDFLACAQHLDPAFARALQYVAIERRPRPALPDDCPLRWVQSAGFPLRGLTGCVISNELVDALPVHRVTVRGGRLQEVYLALHDGRLAEELDEPSTPDIAAILESQRVRLEEGWWVEVGLAAARWMESVAQGLGRGYVITCDYGDEAERLYAPDRRHGTLAAFYRHAPQSDPYARIGRQDLTAHANFTTLADAGMRHRLQPIVLMTQREFLLHLGAGRFIERVRSLGLPQREHDANVMAMRHLIKPDGLGAFRVLVQAKAAPTRDLACLGNDAQRADDWLRRIATLPVPLLTSEHADLLAARYPHLAGTWKAR